MSGAFWIRIGALTGFWAVVMGAFGAHGFEARLAELGRTETFETAARYQMYHALALLALGIWVLVTKPTKATNVAGWGFFAGTLVFSVSLYVLSLTGIRAMGAITPFGGVGQLVGWGAFLLAAKSSTFVGSKAGGDLRS